jgi:hypothetical protein
MSCLDVGPLPPIAVMDIQLGKLDLLQRLQWVTCKTVTFLSEIAE